MRDMNVYDNNSISARKGADRVRLAPAALLGSNTLDGAKHTIIEIIGNATDEKLAGFGTDLDVYLHEDGSITIRDYGRGVPLGWNDKEQNWNFYLIYEELFAGGKYDTNQDILKEIEANNGWATFKLKNFPYLITIGLNGVGAAATQCSSEFFEVASYRDGIKSYMKYEEGIHVLDELEESPTDEDTGTCVHWKPDNRVFTEVNIPAKWLEKLCYSLSYIAGFNVNFYNKNNLKTFEKSDIETIMKEDTGNCAKAHNFIHVYDEVGDIYIVDAEVAIGSSGRGSEFYHNYVSVSGGSHSNAFGVALYQFFLEISTEVGVRVKEVDYANRFSIIISSLSNKLSPRGQTKDSIDDHPVYACLYECIYSLLKQEYQKGSEWVTDIVEEVIENAQNRIAVAAMSKSLREIEKTTKKSKVSHKFRSCETYKDGNAAATEFLIVEGDSAGGKVKVAKSSVYQCYLAIRGKSLNLYKASIEQLIANKEIQDIISVLGCGVELGIDGYASFDISKLKVGKIIFCADADIDGKHIIMLLFLIFWKLFPELLYEGYVYVAETPLYVLLDNTNTEHYCMSYEEAMEKKSELGSTFIKMDRFKGLGETDAKTLWDTTLNPESRHLRQIKIDRNDTGIYETLEILFGKSTERRKRAILGGMLGESFDDTMDEISSLSEYIDSLDMNQLEIQEVEL